MSRIWHIPDDLWNEMTKILPPEANMYSWKTYCTIQEGSGEHNKRPKDWMSVEEDTKRIRSRLYMSKVSGLFLERSIPQAMEEVA